AESSISVAVCEARIASMNFPISSFLERFDTLIIAVIERFYGQIIARSWRERERNRSIEPNEDLQRRHPRARRARLGGRGRHDLRTARTQRRRQVDGRQDPDHA